MPDDQDSFAELPAAEANLLWAMRVWVMGHLRQQDAAPRIAESWRDLGIEEAFPFLEAFIWALSRGALRPLEILCLCRTEVSADERLLLDAFALLQQDEAAEGHALLCTILSEKAATIALRSAESVGDHFAAAGLILPWHARAYGGQQASAPQRTFH